SGDNSEPVWSPDDKQILFAKIVERGGANLYVKPADNSADEKQVLQMQGAETPSGWLKDGTILLTHNQGAQNLFALAVLGAAAGSEAKPYVEGRWSVSDFTVSPNGRLAAFVSSESGNPSIEIRDYPVPRGK